MNSEPKSAKPISFSPTRRRGEAPTEDKPERLTAGIPLVKLIKRKFVKSATELVMIHQAHSVAAERFRRLRTMLVSEAGKSLGVLVVTSPGPGEGKSLVSLNLALAFALEKEGEVLLVDADMRRPSVARLLEPRPRLGLPEILMQQTELDHAILELEDSPLRVLPSCSPPQSPVELLTSREAEKLFSELRSRFRYIIIDTPPVVPFTDADVLGRLSDGVLLVARAESTQKSMFTRAVQSITSAPILGTVLNDATYNLADRGYYQEKYYYDYYDKTRKE